MESEILFAMSNRATSLLALRAFDAAARQLSFTNAARELHVSQAAISRHVRALEEDLGRPLFRRLHRQVELTLVPRFGRFTTANPEIEVDIESSEEMRTLGRDTDIAIRFLNSATRKSEGSARKLFAVVGFPVIASGAITWSL
jgi:LysR family transcriptional regulator, glycine cleavage system transcriptional activator